MRLKIFTLFFFLFLNFLPSLQAESPNPFFSGSASSVEQKKSSNFFKKNSRFQRIYAVLGSLQRDYNKKITTLISNYRESKNRTLMVYVFMIAVGYGFFHAMMPGHGKSIVLGWIMSSQKKFYKVFITATLGMVMHVFTAIVMVYTIWLLIGGRISTQSTEFTKYFSFFAFAILCFMALRQLWSLIPKKGNAVSCRHHHELDHISDTTTIKACLITAATIGMIPCPVSTVLIVFMISQGFHLEGLLTGGFFALGMAGTLLIYSTLIWSFRSILLRKRTPLLGRLFDVGLPVFGSVLLIFSGFTFILPYL